jgi:DNA polymerase III epsilon subunit family exonuclease
MPKVDERMMNFGEPLWMRFIEPAYRNRNTESSSAIDKLWHVDDENARLPPPLLAKSECPLPSDWETRRYAALDVETTGLDPSKDKILEVGIVDFCLDSEGALVIEDEWSTLINPGIPIPASASAIHGIIDLEVVSAPTFVDVYPKINELLDGRVFVAHNAPFDLGFFRSATKCIGKPDPVRDWADSLGFARLAFPGLVSYNLGKAAFILGIESGSNHRALDDAKTCMRVFLQCARKLTGSCE